MRRPTATSCRASRWGARARCAASSRSRARRARCCCGAGARCGTRACSPGESRGSWEKRGPTRASCATPGPPSPRGTCRGSSPRPAPSPWTSPCSSAPGASRSSRARSAGTTSDPGTPCSASGGATFAGIRPLSELRVGAALVRERWEAFVGAETTAIFALPHLAGFREPGVPAVVAVRPVEGPVVVGASAFAPRGLAPAFPAGDVRLAHAGRTVGWVVGPGSTWTRPTDAGPALRVAGLALRGGFDLVAAPQRLLAADLATRLADSDPIPRGSTLIGDPAWLALHETAVEPGVVFDTAAGPIVLESGVALKSGTRLQGPPWGGGNTHPLRRPR